MAENTFFDLACRRRSVRSYTGAHVSDAAIRSILESVLLAPSSFGRHPVEFWVVRDAQTLREVAACKRIGAPTVAAADTAIVVAVDTDDCELWVEDGSVASTYVLLAAEEAGVGACWNQIHDRMGRRASASDEIKAVLGIPERFEVVSVIALGVPAVQSRARTKADLDFSLVHMV